MGPGVPCIRPQLASGYDMAKSWSASIVGQARIRTVKFPMYPASKPTIGVSPLALPSHMPTIRESVPSDHRTKRCRRGSEPIVYGSRPCNFAAVGKVAESEESRSLGLRPWFDSLQSRFGDFLPITLTPRKFHN